jgi:hypothetical protein
MFHGFFPNATFAIWGLYRLSRVKGLYRSQGCRGFEDGIGEVLIVSRRSRVSSYNGSMNVFSNCVDGLISSQQLCSISVSKQGRTNRSCRGSTYARFRTSRPSDNISITPNDSFPIRTTCRTKLFFRIRIGNIFASVHALSFNVGQIDTNFSMIAGRSIYLPRAIARNNWGRRTTLWKTRLTRRGGRAEPVRLLREDRIECSSIDNGNEGESYDEIWMHFRLIRVVFEDDRIGTGLAMSRASRAMSMI